MTSNGTDTFLKTSYQVGIDIYYNLENALEQLFREQKETSGCASIEVEQHYEY